MARKKRTAEENVRREKIRELLQLANIGSILCCSRSPLTVSRTKTTSRGSLSTYANTRLVKASRIVDNENYRQIEEYSITGDICNICQEDFLGSSPCEVPIQKVFCNMACPYCL